MGFAEVVSVASVAMERARFGLMVCWKGRLDGWIMRWNDPRVLSTADVLNRMRCIVMIVFQFVAGGPWRPFWRKLGSMNSLKEVDVAEVWRRSKEEK